MKQNLSWAAGYNLIAVPLAAGVLAPVGFVLPMSVGAMLMSASTVVVAAQRPAAPPPRPVPRHRGPAQHTRHYPKASDRRKGVSARAPPASQNPLIARNVTVIPPGSGSTSTFAVPTRIAASRREPRARTSHLQTGRIHAEGLELLVSPFGPSRPACGRTPRSSSIHAGQPTCQVSTTTCDHFWG